MQPTYLLEQTNNNTVQNCNQSLITSRILVQTVAVIAFAACKFSPAMMVRLVMMGFELKVSSASAVLYWSTSSCCCCWWWRGPRTESLLSESLSLSLALYLEGFEPDNELRLTMDSSANLGFFRFGSALDLSIGLRELSISITTTHTTPNKKNQNKKPTNSRSKSWI